MSEENDNREPEAERRLAPVSGLGGGAGENTDKHLWRKEGGLYAPSIHVTKSGGIGINVGGHVIVMPVEKWHALGRLRCAIEDVIAAV